MEEIVPAFIVIVVVVAGMFIVVRLAGGSSSGKCSRCGRFSKRLIPNEDARRQLLLCKMCNAELEIEHSLKVTRQSDD